MNAEYTTLLQKVERQLFPANVRETVPALYSTEDVASDEKMVVAKFFCANWTWYVIEGSPVDSEGIMQSAVNEDTEDFYFFGLVDGFERELGYFSLEELANLQGPLGLKVERDEWFKPTLLKDV